MTTQGSLDAWPALDYPAGKETIDALHMWTQVVGKVKIALTRVAPEWQNVPLFVNGRGLTTGLLQSGGNVVELAFDLVDHRLGITTSDGRRDGFELLPCPLRDFTAQALAALDRLGMSVTINPVTVEVPNPVRCDLHEGYDAYDPEVANRLYRILAQAVTLFEDYRAGFWGKQPPVSFWWGTFDLAVTRYNLVPVPPSDQMDLISRVGGDSEQAAVGFWPGNDRYAKPAFFALTYPKPEGLEDASLRPGAARWSGELGEFLLDYDDVRMSKDPRAAVREFANSAYEAGAELAGWDRELLERPPPQ
jgi:Family of unknown function (DUF5996)